MSIGFGDGEADFSFSGSRQTEHKPAPGTTIVRAVSSIDDLAPGDCVGLNITRSGTPAGSHRYIGHVRRVDKATAVVELSPFKNKFLRDVLPPSLIIDINAGRARGLISTYDVAERCVGIFNAYITAD